MAQTYLKKINSAARSERISHGKLFMVILVFLGVAMLCFPFEFSIKHYYTYGQSNPDDVTAYVEFISGFGLGALIAVSIIGMIAVFSIFKDMVKQQTADVQMSLPLDSKQRYLSKIVTLAEIHILPLLAAEIVILIITLIKVGFSAENFGLIVGYLSRIFASAVFIDAISIFCMCCCGAIAEGVYTSLILMFCISVTPYLYFVNGIQRFSGVNAKSESYMKFFIWGLTPLYFDYTGYMLVSCLISVLLIVLTYFIYKKRDARTVGKPVVYNLFFELVLFLGVFTILTVFCFNETYFMGLAISVIVYFIIRAVSIRGRLDGKTAIMWFVKFGGTIAAFVVISAVGYVTGGFGYKNISFDVSDYSYGRVIIYESEFMSYTREFASEPAKIDKMTEYQGKNVEMCKDAVEIFRKYNNVKQKSLDQFLDIMLSDYSRSSRDGYKNMHIILSAIDNGYSNLTANEFYEYSDGLFSVDFWVKDSDVAAMEEELSAVGLELDEVKETDYYDYMLDDIELY